MKKLLGWVAHLWSPENDAGLQLPPRARDSAAEGHDENEGSEKGITAARRCCEVGRPFAADIVRVIMSKRDWQSKIDSPLITTQWLQDVIRQSTELIEELCGTKDNAEDLLEAERQRVIESITRVFHTVLRMLHSETVSNRDAGKKRKRGDDALRLVDDFRQLVGYPLPLEQDHRQLIIQCRCRCAVCAKMPSRGRRPIQPRAHSRDEDTEPAGGILSSGSDCRCAARGPSELASLRHAFLSERVALLNTIPESCRQRLVTHLARHLSETPEQELDWHPGSQQMILDVVHPSMYCYVRGVTQLSEHRACEPAAAVTFQWLPTNFVVTPRIPNNDAGDDAPGVAAPPYQCVPQGAINGIHCELHKDLHEVVCEVLGHLIEPFARLIESVRPEIRNVIHNADDATKVTPLAAHILSTTPNIAASSAARHGHTGTRQSGRSRGAGASPPPPPLHDATPLEVLSAMLPRSQKRGLHSAVVAGQEAHLQVIVKLASLRLTCDKPQYEGGQWHLEGIPQEHIIATAVYYFDQDNIAANSLEFRTIPDSIEYPSGSSKWLETHCGFEVAKHDDTYQPVIPLGSIPTTKGSVLLFPNCFLHRVSPVQLLDATRGGQRDILVLFFVDPKRPITSTMDVTPPPPGTRDGPPVTPLRRWEAQQYRELLMHQRKYVMIDHRQYFERSFSLCEH